MLEEKKLTLPILYVIRNHFFYEKKNHRIEYESTITLMFKRFDLNIKKIKTLLTDFVYHYKSIFYYLLFN